MWAAWTERPIIMGILNVTPDSFSDGGDHLNYLAAIEAGRRMIADGAGILDVGGDSTRPNSAPTDASAEQNRILPVVAGLAGLGVPISVDTRNAGTMAAALDAGATIVNDVSALRHDRAAATLVAKRGCPVILMHMRGTPATMNGLAHYADVAAEVAAELADMASQALQAGVAREQIALDPGVGFAKIGEQNHDLLRALPQIAALGFPLVVGVSRKAFVGRLTGQDNPRDRGAGSLAGALFALSRGAAILRVHDVAATAAAVRVWQALAA